MSENTLHFSLKGTEEYGQLPKILVMGVGGAGCNAVNNMVSKNIDGIDFAAVNTDMQSLAGSKANKIIQIGAKITGGQGAGCFPEIGLSAAEESKEQIEEALNGVQLLFLTTGMGGGTGTGATPYIAKMAKEMDILTIAVVTKPFQHEEGIRLKLAEQGIAELRKYVDTMIVLPNENLFKISTKETTLANAFASSDEVLYLGVRGIADLITTPGIINLDFADVRMVIKKMGRAIMGMGEAEGENRAIKAVEEALSNPLLEDVNIKGATGALVNITGSPDITLFEYNEAARRVKEEIGSDDAMIKVGMTFMKELEGKIRVSIFATGMQESANNDMTTSETDKQEKIDGDEDDLNIEASVETIKDDSNKNAKKEYGDDLLSFNGVHNTSIKEEKNEKPRVYTGKTKLTASSNDENNDDFFDVGKPFVEDDLDINEKSNSSFFDLLKGVVSKKKDKDSEKQQESTTFKVKNREIEFKNNNQNNGLDDDVLEIPAYLRKKK